MFYNILDFGAVGDGITLNTASIQNAVDTCFNAGGGTVMIPSGVFVTGTFYLKSNVELHLCHGSVLKASGNLADYNPEDAYLQNFGCLAEEWVGKHLILAIEVSNVAITGTGVIDGNGDSFFGEPNVFMEYVWRNGLALARDKKDLRPGQLICFVESTDITVRDITVKNAPCWSVYLHGSEKITVSGVKISNPPYAANTDGIDIDCCKYVTVTGCIIETGDDCIAIRCNPKTLKNKNKECEFITVSNCTLSSASSVFRMGVGNGKIHNVRVSNIVISGASVGINFCSCWGSTTVSDISDVNFSNISGVNVCMPIFFYAKEGTIKNITLENMRFRAIAGSYITNDGCNALEDITLKSIDIHIDKEDRELTDKSLDERGKEMFRVHNVNKLRLDNIRISYDTMETWNDVFKATDCKNTEIKDCLFK